MAVEGTSHTACDRHAPVGVRRPALARAMSLVLWLLAMSLLAAVVLQNVIGQAGLLAVHVPLGVAIVGLVGTLLGRTRNLTRPATHPTSS
jgi:hypothetical protein